MSYYNTTNLTGTELDDSHEKSQRQEYIVLGIFQRHKELTASDAWSYYTARKRAPLTSIRRSITNLTTDGHLKKTDRQKIGMYGKPEYIYKLNT